MCLQRHWNLASKVITNSTKGAATSRRLVAVFFFGYDAGNRTGRRTAVRKKAAGGRFFSPRVDSRQRHHKGSSHQPQVGGCFLFGYDAGNRTGRRLQISYQCAPRPLTNPLPPPYNTLVNSTNGYDRVSAAPRPQRESPWLKGFRHPGASQPPPSHRREERRRPRCVKPAKSGSVLSALQTGWYHGRFGFRPYGFVKK